MGCLNPIFCVSCRHRKTGPRPASHVRPFTDRFHRLIRPLLTSAVPSRRLATPVAHLSPGAGRQTSQGKTRDLRAMHLSHLRLHPPGDIGLRVSLPPRPDADASYALPVRQAGTLPTASFRSRIAPGTLAVQLAVPITRVRRGLPPPSHRSATTPTKRCSHTTRHAWRTKKKAPRRRARRLVARGPAGEGRRARPSGEADGEPTLATRRQPGCAAGNTAARGLDL